MSQRYDVLGFGLVLFGTALLVASGFINPFFEVHPSSADLASWVQAITSVVALIGVFVAAMIPVRAQQRAKDREDRLRASALGRLIIPELAAFRGEIKSMITKGSLRHDPIYPPSTLLGQIENLYLLGDTGGRMLQAVGLLNGVAAQTIAVHARLGRNRGTAPPFPGEDVMWKNHQRLMELAMMNIDAAMPLRSTIRRGSNRQSG